MTSNKAMTTRRGRPPMLPKRAARRRAPEHRPSAADGDQEVGTDALAEALGEGRVRKLRPRDASTFLAKYFRDMATLDVLEPQQEFVAARELEHLETCVWQAILSWPPAADTVIGVVETCLENTVAEFRPLRRAAADLRRAPTKATQSRYQKAAGKCAAVLQALDTDKIYVDAVLAELARIERSSSARPVRGRQPFATGSRAFAEWNARIRRATRQAGSARNEFVEANLRLVVSIARRFNHGRMALADLIQEGNIGLMKAVERYDYRRGFRFSTYASWWIRHAISRALADKGREVRLPVHMIDAQHRLAKAKRELQAKLGRQPTTDELAAATNLAPDKIEKMRSYLAEQPFSLDRPVNDEDGRHFIEFIHDPTADDKNPAETMAIESLSDEVRTLLAELKPIEADILRQRFGFDDDRELTLKEIGAKYNLSRERIRQLQEQALSKMRRALQRKDML
ncbi:MAG TPA: sigma-70 family RNA polymerase sigma factor [Kofleriaceae bacterium]|nr:sigma-70 family RNA polymerase sigma factor [Kofleriaceae bacterium]